MVKLLSLALVAVLVSDSVKTTDGHDCWTQWFDRDDPSGTGDWETLHDLHKEYPGKICPKPSDIEFKTLSGLTATAAGDVVYKGDVYSGFICRNNDQHDKKCNDYRVRFKCSSPYCDDKVCWTKWYDRDQPSGTGDWELLNSLRIENPGEICEDPTNIEVVTTDTITPALNTGEVFYIYSPTTGFVCRNKDQKCHRSCRDYKVRFECPCATLAWNDN